MDNDRFKRVLNNCPRVVPVFMVSEDVDKLSKGSVLYWCWTGELMSHKGPVSVHSSKLLFAGYAAMSDLGDHKWPSLGRLIDTDEPVDT